MYVCKRTNMVTWAYLSDGHELLFLYITQLNAPAYRLTRTQTIVPAQGPTPGRPSYGANDARRVVEISGERKK